jgi:hypothetical protein
MFVVAFRIILNVYEILHAIVSWSLNLVNMQMNEALINNINVSVTGLCYSLLFWCSILLLIETQAFTISVLIPAYYLRASQYLPDTWLPFEIPPVLTGAQLPFETKPVLNRYQATVWDPASTCRCLATVWDPASTYRCLATVRDPAST